jgi:hypothetical protein
MKLVANIKAIAELERRGITMASMSDKTVTVVGRSSWYRGSERKTLEQLTAVHHTRRLALEILLLRHGRMLIVRSL